MALPKKKQFIQEVVEPAAPEAQQPEFLQEVVEPEVQVPVEPEVLVEEETEDKTTITSRYSHLNFKK